MSLLLVPRGDHDIFTYKGDMKVNLLPQISPQLSKYIQANPGKNLIFDLSGVGFIDSSTIRMFINLHKRLQPAGKRLCLLAPTPFVENLLDDMKLGTVFTIFAGTDDLEKENSDALRTAYAAHTEQAGPFRKLKASCPVCGSAGVQGYLIDESEYGWKWEGDDPFPSGFIPATQEPVDVFSLFPVVCPDCFMSSIVFSHFNACDSGKTAIKSVLSDEAVHQISKTIKARKKLMESCVVIGDGFFDHPRQKIACYYFYLLAESCARCLATAKAASAPFLMGYINYLAVKYAPAEKKDGHITNTRTWLSQVIANSAEYGYSEIAKSYFILFMVAMTLEKPKEAVKLFEDFSAFMKTLPVGKAAQPAGIQSPEFWYSQTVKLKRESPKPAPK
jgi:anti-anti-sigma factor